MARKRRSFTPEFKAEAVRLCRVGDRPVGQVARDLDLTETCLRSWLKNAEQRVEQGGGIARGASARSLSDAEQEILRLQQKVKRLEMDREILKKAAAFFAKESE